MQLVVVSCIMDMSAYIFLSVYVICLESVGSGQREIQRGAESSAPSAPTAKTGPCQPCLLDISLASQSLCASGGWHPQGPPLALLSSSPYLCPSSTPKHGSITSYTLQRFWVGMKSRTSRHGCSWDSLQPT